MKHRFSALFRASLLVLATSVLAVSERGAIEAQAPLAGHQAQHAEFSETDVRRWLTYLASDLMQGRAVFTEGYGLASSYVAEQLREIGVEPMGEEGTYFQPVIRRTYKVSQNASVTVRANGQTRTFTHGEHVTFPAIGGSPQTVQLEGVEFVGYGLGEPASALNGKLALLLSGAPQTGQAPARRASSAPSLTSRATLLVESHGAGATIAFSAARGGNTRRGGNDTVPAGPSDFVSTVTTVQRVDRPRPPMLTGDETFFEFLFSGAPVPFSELRERAGRGEPLPSSTLANVTVTIAVNNTYEVQRTDRTQNVVGIVRGTDPRLKDTYVFFGAHLDHEGYAADNQPPGRVNTPLEQDAIWNGADDDGSGSVAVLALAKAFARGPKPARSVVFVWHAGEEEGLLGSQRMVDDPVVPLDRIQAVFNIDMIGRNRDDNPEESNTVFVIGADRISTDLHNLLIATNGAAPQPLNLDFEYNDVADPNSYYTRSDHYSYASKGIPAAFFFTGSHADYHANTDTVDKILFPKLLRITRFIYEAGFRVADMAQVLGRDHLGSRSGRGFSGPLPNGSAR